MRLIPELVLTPAGWERDRAVAITDGRIAAVQSIGTPHRTDVALPGRALLPGTVNSHCHTFQSLLRGLGDDLDFMGCMLRAGVRVGLGTDGGCTNNRLSVFEEMRTCSLLQRVRLLDGTALSASTAFDLSTRSAAAMLGLEAGTIAGGQLADLVAVDLDHLSLPPRSDLLESMVYAMSPEAITDVWVHGRRVVEGRRLTTLSEAELVARVSALTRGWSL